MANFFEVLKERGFVSQATHEDLPSRFERGPVTGYIGFDPTSASLHAGSLIQILMLVHLQRCGHRPIAIVGGATGLIGDPSGKTEMRAMLTEEDLARNLEGIRAQLSRFIRFGDGPTDALILDNAEWLRDRKYIEFLREVGPHFSVNRMLTLESVKLRMEKGLSFLEFNYQVLQAYDFMMLNRRYGCTLQMGGDDQWGNIVMGMELARRMNGAEVFGITSPLIATADGRKMGKTEGGAVWLDAERTSPYAFYQYWINIPDADVERFLGLYTFLPMERVRELGRLPGEAIREAKKVLAYEVTALVHGGEEADRARETSESVFGGGPAAGELDAMPTTDIARDKLQGGMPIVDLLIACGIAPSKREARRLISGGGIAIGEERVGDSEARVDASAAGSEGWFLIRKGKKSYHRVRVV